MAALSAQCSAVRTPELRVARRSTAARAPPPHARPVSALLSSRVALGGPALPARPRVSCRAPRPAAFAPAALFAQNKESVQWTTVVATVLSCVAFVVPLVRARASRGDRGAPTGRTSWSRNLGLLFCVPSQPSLAPLELSPARFGHARAL